jgi:autotransporter-associated beta strand protein
MKIRRTAQRFNAAVMALILSTSTVLAMLIPGIAHAAGPFTCTWTGAGSDTNFSTAANWSGCNGAAPQPADNDALVFDDTTATIVTPHNDLVGASFSSITFQGDGSFGSYTVDGNQFTLAGDITVISGGDFNEIDNDMVISGDHNVSSGGGVDVVLGGALSGSGNLTKSGLGELDLLGDNSGYSGTFTINAGELIVESANGIATSGGTVVNDGADVSFIDCSSASFAGDLTLSGSSSDTSGDLPIAKLNAGGLCGGSTQDEIYGQAAMSETITLTGNITLGSDVTFSALPATTNLTGAISGAHHINLVPGYGGKLVVQGSSNTSLTPNGTYSAPVFTKTLSDSVPADTVSIEGNSTVTIDGTRSDTSVAAGSTLQGNGTVGQLSVASGGAVAPGHSPGCLNTGNLTLSGTYQAEIGGTTACSGYDQLKVTGTVNVTGGTLSASLYNGYQPKAGETYAIIDNDGSDAVTGTFTGLAEGATFNLGGYVLQISYAGGDGNDVVLSVKSVPATPDTGFGLIASHPAFTLLSTTLMAGGIFGIAKRSRRAEIRIKG